MRKDGTVSKVRLTGFAYQQRPLTIFYPQELINFHLFIAQIPCQNKGVLSAAVRGKKACWILVTSTKVILELERRDLDWQRALWG